MKRDAIDFGTVNVARLFRKIFIPTLLGMLSMSAVTAVDGAYFSVVGIRSQLESFEIRCYRRYDTFYQTESLFIVLHHRVEICRQIGAVIAQICIIVYVAVTAHRGCGTRVMEMINSKTAQIFLQI